MMAPKHRNLRRKKFSRDDRLILIACEDTYACPQYFNGIKESILRKRVSRRIDIVILDSEGLAGSPEHVHARLREYKENNLLYDFDELWLVLDTDHWVRKNHIANYTRVCKEAKEQGIGLANSNPCFEYWLLLHVSEVPEEMLNAKDVEKQLKTILRSYNKTKINLADFLPYISLAIRRARNSDPSPGKDWPESPGSHVYRIFDSIGLENIPVLE